MRTVCPLRCAAPECPPGTPLAEEPAAWDTHQAVPRKQVAGADANLLHCVPVPLLNSRITARGGVRMSARVVFTTLGSLQRPSEYCIGLQKERVPSKAVKVAPIPSPPPRCSPLPRHCSQPAAATPPSFSRRSTTRAPWLSLRASAAAARTLHAAPYRRRRRSVASLVAHHTRRSAGASAAAYPSKGSTACQTTGLATRSARVGFKTCA